MATVITNNSIIPFVEVEDNTTIVNMEFGAQLTEYKFTLASDISGSDFLGNVSKAVSDSRFPAFLRECLNNSTLIPVDENHTLTPPMLLSLESFNVNQSE